MSDETGVLVFGIFVAFVGFLLIVSVPFDNLVMGLTGMKTHQLQDISIISLFGGATFAVVAWASAKKSSK
jgi:hypothetical protein